MTVRIGLVGYGMGGRWFHAPYIRASDKCELVGVVARSARSRVAVWEDDPDLPTVDSLTELIALGVDAVVISTPPHTRRALVLEAIGAGVAVVADKPFAPGACGGRELVRAAREAGVLLNVFHNRRQDTDIVTALKVRTRLGRLHGLDLRFDLDEPDTLDTGPQGGLLRDLGSHVVDQALQLMGPARAVTAQLGYVDGSHGPTDVRFRIYIEHESGALSNLSASKIDRLQSREIRLYGEYGTYISDYSDVQTARVLYGEMPIDARSSWGYESPGSWGVLRTPAGEETIASEQGDYTRFYDAFAEAVVSGGPGPVPGEEAVAVLRVLDAAIISAEEGRTCPVQ